MDVRPEDEASKTERVSSRRKDHLQLLLDARLVSHMQCVWNFGHTH